MFQLVGLFTVTFFHIFTFLLGILLCKPVELRRWLGLSDTSEDLGRVSITISLIGYLLMIYAVFQAIVLLSMQVDRLF